VYLALQKEPSPVACDQSIFVLTGNYGLHAPRFGRCSHQEKTAGACFIAVDRSLDVRHMVAQVGRRCPQLHARSPDWSGQSTQQSLLYRE
jgi:hypothetical protein